MENNILTTLTKEQKNYISIKTVSKNTTLFREGENCEMISMVVSGEIKISSYSFEGEELIYNVLKSNEIFGNNLIFSDEPFYKGDVVATKESVIASIKRENLLKILQSNKEFLMLYLNIHSNFSKKLNSTIKLLSFNKAEERFIFYLHENNNVIQIKSIVALASILHLQRETLSRIISKLEKENVIKRSPYQIKLITNR